MDRSDFMHLLRRSEQASADNPARYRRGVAAFALLGYAWVVGALLLALGVLALVALHWAQGGRFRGGYVMPAFFACGLLWASVGALRVRAWEPEGVELREADAPRLFALLEQIRKRVRGPRIHRVYLDDTLNALIVQQPRLGLLGASANRLVVGLPLLMALDVPRATAILAHEYGHLRGDHGRLAAWIYRSRQAWARLHAHTAEKGDAFSGATRRFLAWYAPRFSARSWALARQDEYEADAIAARVAGAEAAACALGEINVKAAWLKEHFWPAHWRGAAREPLPQGPFALMHRMLAAPVEPSFAHTAFRAALRRLPEVDDTHPGLRERLVALDPASTLPAPPAAWSRGGALSLLAERTRWVQHFDRAWRRDNAAAWRHHHARLALVQARVDALRASTAPGAGASVADLVEHATLLLELGGAQPHVGATQEAVALLQRALAQDAASAPALRGLVRAQAGQGAAVLLPLLERLHAASAGDRWWAAQNAVALLEQPAPGTVLDEPTLKRWRERLRAAAEAEEQVHEALAEPPHLHRLTPHGLGDFALARLRHELVAERAVQTAWLVQKRLPAHPGRTAWLLLLDLPREDDQARWHCCRALESRLPLDGPVLALWAGHDPTLADIRRQCFAPVYTRGGAAA